MKKQRFIPWKSSIGAPFIPNPWHHRSVLFFSRDHGLSWPEHVVVTEDPENRVFYWDQRSAALADGSILDLFWTYDTRAAL